MISRSAWRTLRRLHGLSAIDWEDSAWAFVYTVFVVCLLGVAAASLSAQC